MKILKILKTYRSIIDLIITVLVIYFVYSNFKEMLLQLDYNLFQQFRWWRLVLSTIFYILFICVLTLSWSIIFLNSLNIDFSLFPVYWVTAVGKYIPGTVWIVALKERFFNKKDKIKAIGSGLLEIIAVILSSFFIGGYSLFKYLDNLQEQRIYNILYIVLVIVMVYFSPFFINLSFKILGKFFIRKDFNASFNQKIFNLALVINCISWLFSGLSLFFIKGGNFNLIDLFVKGSALAASYTVSFIVFFIPAGIGVRDKFLAFLLGNSPEAYAIAMIYRGVSLIGDIVLASIGLLILYQLRKSSKKLT